ncbi:hypothetical protein ACA910_022539 [Epithemia clementina (nom. ined.)]
MVDDVSSPVKSTTNGQQHLKNNTMLPSPTSVMDSAKLEEPHEDDESNKEDKSTTITSLGNPQQGPTGSATRGSGSMTAPSYPEAAEAAAAAADEEEEEALSKSKSCSSSKTTTTTTTFTVKPRPSKIVPPKKHTVAPHHHQPVLPASTTSNNVVPSPQRKARTTVPQPLNLSTSNKVKKGGLSNNHNNHNNHNNNTTKDPTDQAAIYPQRAKSTKPLTKPQAPKLATASRATARPRPTTTTNGAPVDEETTSVHSYRSQYTTQTSRRRVTTGSCNGGTPAYLQPTASSRNRTHAQQAAQLAAAAAAANANTTTALNGSRSSSVPPSARNAAAAAAANSPEGKRRRQQPQLTKPVGPKFLLDAKYGEKKVTPTIESSNTENHARNHAQQQHSSSSPQYVSSASTIGPSHSGGGGGGGDDGVSFASAATSRSHLQRRPLTVPMGPKFRLDAKYGEKHLSASSAVTHA